MSAAVYMPMHELRKAVGAEAADVLMREFGGGRLYVGRRPAARVVELIGEDAARRLSENLASTGIGGLSIELPTNGRHRAATERWSLVKAHPDRPDLMLAHELGVHPRTIRRIRASIRDEEATRAKRQACRPVAPDM